LSDEIKENKMDMALACMAESGIAYRVLVGKRGKETSWKT
jgi:hypothetical protein